MLLQRRKIRGKGLVQRDATLRPALPCTLGKSGLRHAVSSSWGSPVCPDFPIKVSHDFGHSSGKKASSPRPFGGFPAFSLCIHKETKHRKSPWPSKSRRPAQAGAAPRGGSCHSPRQKGPAQTGWGEILPFSGAVCLLLRPLYTTRPRHFPGKQGVPKGVLQAMISMQNSGTAGHRAQIPPSPGAARWPHFFSLKTSPFSAQTTKKTGPCEHSPAL